VARSSPRARAAYTAQVRRYLDLFADLTPADDPDDPYLILAALVGAIGLARAVDDPGLSDEILDRVARALHRHVQGERAPSAPGVNALRGGLLGESGGNFIATANAYTNGTAGQMVGEFARSRRDQLMIATKYTMAARPGDANSGAMSRKSTVRSVEGSLSRLRTDHVDLPYLHMWDGLSPASRQPRGVSAYRG
jgi:Aldo/keto reductase family